MTILKFFQARWFLTGLSTLIIGGLVCGYGFPGPAKFSVAWIHSLSVTACILFLMSFSLDSRQLALAVRYPGPVLLGTVLNAGLAPVLGIALQGLQANDDFRYGLMVAACVPCTMAAASVITRKAHGNDAVSLLVTLITNMACVVVAPFWLEQATHWGGRGESEQVQQLFEGGQPLFDATVVMRELIIGVVLPIVLGQLLRQPRAIGGWAQRYKSPMGAAAQMLILVMVWSAAVKGGIRLGNDPMRLGLGAFGIVLVSVIAIHLLTMLAGLWAARAVHMSPADQVAVAFAGSQKTLPVGLYLSETLGRSAGLHFAVFPILMYHCSQLFLDTMLADRWSKDSPPVAKP